MRRLIVAGLTLVVLLGASGRGMAATDKRELEAREFFAAGRYQEALDDFAKLYAEKLHPVYLRNIGRCYQNLAQPDRAINSFREYLRKMKHISADERAEIEGYIHEMEDLQKSQAAASSKAPVEPLPSAKAPAKTPAEPVNTAPPPPPTAPPPASNPNPAMVVTHDQSPGPSSSDSPVYTRWWFWTVIGVVAVGAGLGVAAAAGAFKSKDAPCGGIACS